MYSLKDKSLKDKKKKGHQFIYGPGETLPTP